MITIKSTNVWVLYGTPMSAEFFVKALEEFFVNDANNLCVLQKKIIENFWLFLHHMCIDHL